VAEPAQGQTGMMLIARLQSVCQEINLSGDVRTRIDAILAHATDAAEKAQTDAKDDRAAFGTISEVMRGATVEIMRLLNDDQKLRFQSKMRTAAEKIVPGAGADGGSAAEGRAVPIGKRIKNAVAPLKLSEEQNRKIDGVIQELEAKIAELRKRDIGMTELRETMQAMRQDLIRQLRETLSEEQFTKFQENIRQPQNGRQDAAGAGAKLVPHLRLLWAGMQQLGLTEEQKTKVATAFFSANEKLKPILVKVQRGSTPELHDQYVVVTQELKSKLQSVLTAQEWDELGNYVTKNGDLGNGAEAKENDSEK
jgi:hypothetical protein